MENVFFMMLNVYRKSYMMRPEYTQEQFLRAVALHQTSIDKNYETIQKLKRKNLKFKRAGATLFATSLAADIISSVVISRKKEVEMSYAMLKMENLFL